MIKTHRRNFVTNEYPVTTRPLMKKNKLSLHRPATFSNSAVTKLTLFSSIGVAIIGLVSGFLGNYVGQRTAAVSEADKIVREKLEFSYSKTMSINDFARNLNSAAVSNAVTVPISNLNEMGRYNDAVVRFQNAVVELVTPVELYGDDIEVSVAKYVQCTKEFNIEATDTYLIRRQLLSQGAYGSIAYDDASKKVGYVSRINSLANKREECQKLNIELRKKIKQEIRKHTPKTIF
jgi:hypothetical protein